jgi:hypothetical protein
MTTAGYWYRFRCKGCDSPAVLPRQGPLGIFAYPQKQPGRIWPITFACAICGHMSEYSAQDIAPAEHLQISDQASDSAALWHLEFGCARENCGGRYSLWTWYLATASQADTIRAVLAKNPKLSCQHDVKPDLSPAN